MQDIRTTVYTLQGRRLKSHTLAAPKKNVPVIATVGTDLKWSKSASSINQNHGLEHHLLFLFFSSLSYISLKRGNNINNRVSFLKAETMTFLVLGTYQGFTVCGSELQSHHHGRKSHTSGPSQDLCHPSSLPYFLPMHCPHLLILTWKS